MNILFNANDTYTVVTYSHYLQIQFISVPRIWVHKVMSNEQDHVIERKFDGVQHS